MFDRYSVEDLLYLSQTGQHLVLLENTLGTRGTGWNYLFTDPIHILRMDRASEFLPFLDKLQRYLQEGYFLAGYMAYECGYFLEKLGRLDFTSKEGPLAWFGVYRRPAFLDPALQEAAWRTLARQNCDEAAYTLQDLHFNMAHETYRQKVEQVREHIRQGDVYQMNLTGRYHFRFAGSPLALYAHLRQTQRTPYSAYIRTDEQDILCASPELFFHLDGQQIIARPMKGTAARGRTCAEDEQRAAWLRADPKNQAENIMILDLLRNDLGRVCTIGSVAVPQLLHVEPYETVLQMTSTVTGTLAQGITLPQLFASLFPCGSITGAPKIKAMEIINQLEETPRGIYTGSIGYFAPPTAQKPAHALFNVAIRTVVLEQGQGVMGIGSGIVYDSQAEDEAAECALKARFLTAQANDFDLLEALLWDGSYHHLEKHLQRMAASARYFGYRWDEECIRSELSRQEGYLQPGQTYKVRLQLTRSGEVTSEHLLIQQEPMETERMIAVSAEPTDSQNRMFFHKTTNRSLYERASRFARMHGYADVLFLNEKGEVTEGAVSNLFIERAGKLLTPPLSCGLLPGIARQCLLEERSNAQEAVLSLDDLFTAEKIFVCNAIRGLRQVKLDATHRFQL